MDSLIGLRAIKKYEIKIKITSGVRLCCGRYGMEQVTR